METPPDSTVDESKHTDVAPREYALPADFDPRAELRASLKAGMQDPAAPAVKKPAPVATVDEPADEPEPEEVDGPQPDEGPAKEEEGAEPNAEELIQNPEALLAAHQGQKKKLEARTEMLQRMAETLGIKDFTKVEEALTEALAARQPGEVPVPVTDATPERPLASVGTVADLKAAEDFWQKREEWCFHNSEGGEVTRYDKNGKPYQKELTKEEVAEEYLFAKNVLKAVIPARAKFLDDIRAEEAKAGEAFPYFSKTAPEEQRNVVLDIYKDVNTYVPEIKHYPRISELLADATTGRLIRLHKHGATVGADGKLKVIALTGGKPAPKPAPKTPPASRAAGSSPPAQRMDHGDAEMETLWAQGDAAGALRASIKAGIRKGAAAA